MHCPSEESLIRFACGEPATDDMSDIEKHIDDCEKCRKELAFIRELEETLSELVRSESMPILSPDECPGAANLAIYLDGGDAPEERRRIEMHLARCRSCLHDLIAAAGEPASAPPQYRQTPARLLDQAIRLGAPAKTARISAAGGWRPRIFEWLEPAFAHPRRLAGAGVLAALAIFISTQLYQRESEVSPRAGVALKELAEGEDLRRAAGEVVAESRLDLNGDLKRALIDHDPKTGSKSELFEIIEKKAPQMPVQQIKNVEIKRNLLVAIASVNDLAGQVKLQLFKDGLLVISADS